MFNSADQTITLPSHRRTISGTTCYSWTTLNTGIDSSGSRFCSTGNDTQSECQVSPCMLFKRMNKWLVSRVSAKELHISSIMWECQIGPHTLTCFRTVAGFTLDFQLQVSCQKLSSNFFWEISGIYHFIHLSYSIMVFDMHILWKDYHSCLH